MRKTSKRVKGLGLPGRPRLAAIESVSLIPKWCLKCPTAGADGGSACAAATFSLFSRSDRKNVFHAAVRLLSGPLISDLIVSAQLCVSVCSNEELWECQPGHLIEAGGGGF